MAQHAGPRIAAVIGSPVAHSLSPVIHQAAFDSAGVDWVYTAFDIARGSAEEAISAMRLLGLAGLSVTMPHKSDVARLVDRLEPGVHLAGVGDGGEAGTEQRLLVGAHLVSVVRLRGLRHGVQRISRPRAVAGRDARPLRSGPGAAPPPAGPRTGRRSAPCFPPPPLAPAPAIR